MLQSWDKAIFLWLNGWVGHWPVLDTAARLVVNDYLCPSILALLLVWLWFSGNDRQIRSRNTSAVLNAVVAQFIANMILKLINLSFFRPRPFDANAMVNLLFYRPWDSSCPSNPATFAFALSVAIFLADRKIGSAALAVATLWVLSRVYCGVHYPLDVIAGAALGGIMAYWLSRRSQTMAWLRQRLLAFLQRLYLA